MLLEIIIYLVLLEIVFFLFTSYIRSKNQWFITSKDKNPVFRKETLAKILEKSYDPILGWDRKPNTSGIEKNEGRVAEWSINSNGARDNLNYNNLKSKISIFGDSFSFAREVNNNETWGYKLSCLVNSNVENFGVGNFGFDQALIKLTNKLKSEDYKPEIVIMGVVPDTISRILSVWKHYYEYGNIFGFKPRYIQEKSKLQLIDNLINRSDKFDKINDYLSDIQENDFFYKKKFLKEIIQFPYSISFLRNLRRNLRMSYETILEGRINKPTPYIMRRNLDYRLKLYEDIRNIELLVEELKIFKGLSEKYGFKAYFLIMPQKDDCTYIKDHNKHFYKALIEKVPDGVECIDAYQYLKELKSEDLNLLYSEDSEYGGHYSPRGNEFIAEIVYNKINT